MMQGCGREIISFLIVLFWITSPTFGEDSQKDSWQEYQAATLSSWSQRHDVQTQDWNRYRNELAEKWGLETKLPEKKIYTEYFGNNQLRVRIDFENGKLLIESLSPATSLGVSQALPRAQTQAIIQKMIKKGVIDLKELPATLNWNTQSDVITGGDGEKRTRQTYQMNLAPLHRLVRVARYWPLVQKWAKYYDVDPAFILAVIERESAFNPRARSWVPAFGLMQIVPRYAGREVLHKTPSEEYLYDPDHNIQVGTAYLKLLNEQHFDDVQAGDMKRYLVTCSYNWGPHRIKKAIQRGRLDLNQAPEPVFQNLLEVVPPETRGYLRGVRSSYDRFKKEILTL